MTKPIVRVPMSARRMRRLSSAVALAVVAAFGAGISVRAQTASLSTTSPGATSSSTNCAVYQSAQAALAQRLAVINASKTNVNSFFSGNGSCIGSGLFSNLDLSQLIPDLAGLLTNGLANLAQAALNAAKQQLCTIVNSQISSVISSINSAIGGMFSSIAGGSVNSLMSSFIPTPNIPGFGTFNLQVPSITQLAAPVNSNSAASLLTIPSNSAAQSVVSAAQGAVNAVQGAVSAVQGSVSGTTQSAGNVFGNAGTAVTSGTAPSSNSSLNFLSQ